MTIPSAKTLTVSPGDSQFRARQILWIRTAAGPQTGFGHLRRCCVLARILQDSCIPAFLLDGNDSWSMEQVRANGWSFYSRALDDAWSVMPDPIGVLIDTRITAGLDQLIAKARERRVPVISIHDLGLSPLPSDIIVDGSVTASPGNVLYKDAVSYCGTDYMILNRIYGRLHLRKKEINETLRSVFVNLGGGDSEQFFLKVLEGLQQWNRELEVIGVPGFIPGIRERLGCKDWRPLHLNWESHDIERFCFEADLAITAGGISAYEALCTGTPLIALSYDSLQQLTIKALVGRNACFDLGLGEKLDPSYLCDVVSLLDSDVELRRCLSKNGKRIVDGRGAERVSEIIRQSIEISAATDHGRGLGVESVGI